MLHLADIHSPLLRTAAYRSEWRILGLCYRIHIVTRTRSDIQHEQVGGHRTLDPPNPVLLLIRPKFDGPSPRSSGSKPCLRAAPPHQDEPDGDDAYGAVLTGRRIRSASQSYIPGTRTYSASRCRACRFIKLVPSHPSAAPVQKPGLHPPASAGRAWLEEGGCLE